MQEDKEKSLNYSSKKVEIIGIYYLYVVKVTYMQRPVSTLNQNLRIHFGRIKFCTSNIIFASRGQVITFYLPAYFLRTQLP